MGGNPLRRNRILILVAPLVLTGCYANDPDGYPLVVEHAAWWSDEANITTTWSVYNRGPHTVTLTEDAVVSWDTWSHNSKRLDVDIVARNPDPSRQGIIHDPAFLEHEAWRPGETKNATLLLHVHRNAHLLREGLYSATFSFAYETDEIVTRYAITTPCKDIHNKTSKEVPCREGEWKSTFLKEQTTR